MFLTIDEQKKALRKEIKLLRKAVSFCEKQNKNAIILQKLVNLKEYADAERIFAYYSTQQEVDTVAFLKRAMKEGKQVFLPKVTAKFKIDFFQTTTFKNLQTSSFGVKEPIENKGNWASEFKRTDLCIVPGLAFTKKGERLGYGGGFYDNFLKDFNGVKLGLCYSAFLLKDIPTEERDQKVEMVLTEQAFYK